MEVAKKALGNRDGHIDPGVVYAIAMHWFEDVPKDWKQKPKPAAPAKTPSNPPKKGKKGKKPPESHYEVKKAKKPAETPSEIKKEKERAKKAAAKKKPAPKVQQGFFFNLLETPAEAPGTEPESEVKE